MPSSSLLRLKRIGIALSVDARQYAGDLLAIADEVIEQSIRTVAIYGDEATLRVMRDSSSQEKVVNKSTPYSSNFSSSAPSGRKCRSTISGVTPSSVSGRHAGLRSLSTIAVWTPLTKSAPATQASEM